jgi:hypothetical protein
LKETDNRNKSTRQIIKKMDFNDEVSKTMKNNKHGKERKADRRYRDSTIKKNVKNDRE